MALNKAGLKVEIMDMLNQLKTEEDQAVGIEKLADKLSTAIDNYVKSGTVSTVVTGSSATGGPVTGSGTGQMS